MKKMSIGLCAVCAVCAVALVGCESPEPMDAALVKELAGLRYPQEVTARSLDIVVRREGAMITLTNRTATVYRGVYVWLNQQYVSRVSEVPIGESGQIELTGFINEHGEPFPVGEFLKPDKSFPVVLAELYISGLIGDDGANDAGSGTGSGVRYRLLVRGGEG